MTQRSGPSVAAARTAAATALYAVVVGYLTIRANARAVGAVIGWDLDIGAVTLASAPTMQNAAILFASSLFAYPHLKAAVTGTGDRRSTAAPALSATLLVVLTGWALVTTEYPHHGGVDSDEAVLVAVLREAGLSSAVHTMAAVMGVVALRSYTHDRSRHHDEASAP